MLDRFGWVAFLLALIPAVVRLPRTRSLLRHIDDPTLPERLLGSRTLIAVVFSFVFAFEITLWTRLAPLTIPLQIVAFALAGWPLRRALFAETWSFPAYLWFYVRLTVAIYGFWILLVASIWLTDLDGTRGWVAAAVLGGVLLVLNEKYAAVIAFILRTKPVASPALLERFAAIIAKTAVTPPNIDYVDMRGGVLVNAIALPGVKKSTVLFTSTLLERFDEDEVVAIFAHELAHLEQHNPAYLKKLRWIGWLLIIATVTITPLVKTVAPGLEFVVSFWPFVILAYMAIRGSHRQKHETESDLRSAALTGQPEVMVRALVKLHEMMKLPRRLDPSAEVHASHPSLARRMQAIRAASGAVADTLQEAVTFRHESTVVTLHADRVVWAEGDVAAYTLAYAALDELRLVADQPGTMRLVASDPAGRKWSMPLASDDVARAHAALNVVDARLRPAPAGASKWEVVGRLVAMICLVAAMITMQLASIVVAALAAIKFEPPLARAAGVAALIGGVFALRDGLVPEYGWILILSAVLLLFVTYRDTREIVSRATWRLVSLIGFFALLAAIPIAMAARNWLAVHQAARLWPGAAIMSLAFAAANWPRRSPAWRAATVLAAAAGVASMALGTTRAADVLVDDPFLSDLQRTRPLPFPAAADSRFEIDFVPQDVILSPNARSIAAVTEDDYEEYVFHAGRPGHALTGLPADAALFADDDRLLLLDEDRGTARLRMIEIDRADTPLWSKEIQLSGVSASIGRDGRTWQLLGTTEAGEFARVTGSIDGGDAARETWPIAKTAGNGRLFPLVARESRLIVHKTSYDRHGLNLGATWQPWVDPWRAESRFIQIDPSGQREVMHSVLDVDCSPSPLTDEDPICWGYDGSRTHVFTLSADATLTPLAMVGGRLSVDVTPGWIVGWSPRPYAVHRASGRVYELGEARGFFAAGGAFAGVVSAREDSAVVELFRITAR